MEEELEQRVRLLDARYVQRRENRKKMLLLSVMTEERREAAAQVQERREAQWEQEREKEQIEKDRLYREQEYDEDAAVVFGKMVRGTVEAAQRDKEEDIAVRRKEALRLRERTAKAVQHGRFRADMSRKRLRQAEAIYAQKKESQMRAHAEALRGTITTAEATSRRQAARDEANCRNNIELDMYRNALEIKSNVLLSDTRSTQDTMKKYIYRAHEETLEWSRHKLQLSANRLVTDVLNARDHHLNMAMECDALIRSNHTKADLTNTKGRRRTQFPGIRRLLAAVVE